MSLKQFAKWALCSGLSKATGRHAVLLPADAADDRAILNLRTTYRVQNCRLTIDLLEKAAGTFAATLQGYEGFALKDLWTGVSDRFQGPGTLTHDLGTGHVRLSGQELGTVAPPARRFCWKLDLRTPQGVKYSRVTGHYRPRAEGEVGESYFLGENYVDHEAQSAGDLPVILKLLEQHAAQGPVLEIGCATGGLLEAVQRVGYSSYGLDISRWAVERAAERLGPDRAWVCNVEHDPIPGEIIERGPFRTLILWMVFEHFGRPFEVLAKLARLAAPDCALLIGTTNADSLTHRIFGPDWEGYFDWTHAGIEQVSAGSLRRELPRLGWQIDEIRTHLLWDGSADPTRATLREWYAADARFRKLLAERELGDLLTCVARRTGP
jgi:2-polyprenyl-3-methyl-5-hydroxy-6-metoxy-1,4-benzoquinol methylase